MTIHFRRHRWLAVTAVTLLLTAAFLWPLSAQDETLEETCAAIWGEWNADEQRCESEISYTITIEYPVEYADYDVVVEPINRLIDSQRDELLNLRPYVESVLDPVPGYFVDLTYERLEHSDAVISLVYTIFIYTGGAHPNSYFATYTFDLDAGEQLSLYDVFPAANDPLAVIAPLAQAQLIERFGDDAEAAWIEEGAAPELENYQNFALTEDSVIFYFEPYQVAAYVYGPSEVEIPLADLADIMAPLG